jgi:hypothetical protein
MAYSASGLTRVGGDSNGSLWMYRSADAIATVRASGYFNDASNMLGVRDIVIVNDTNTPTAHLCIVLSNASGVVDCSDGTAIAETDTD